MRQRPRVAIPLGDPAGVGPEIVVKALQEAVDHGTAFDIAGTGRASAVSMVQAILTAARYAPALSRPKLAHRSASSRDPSPTATRETNAS